MKEKPKLINFCQCCDKFITSYIQTNTTTKVYDASSDEVIEDKGNTEWGEMFCPLCSGDILDDDAISVPENVYKSLHGVKFTEEIIEECERNEEWGSENYKHFDKNGILKKSTIAQLLLKE